MRICIGISPSTPGSIFDPRVSLTAIIVAIVVAIATVVATAAGTFRVVRVIMLEATEEVAEEASRTFQSHLEYGH